MPARKTSDDSVSQPSDAGDVISWPDDPRSGLAAQRVAPPSLDPGPLAVAISGHQPPPAQYEPGSPEFLYWTAAAALQRAADYWAEVLPQGTTWQPGSPLNVFLDEGEDLNAYYDRAGLKFFHERAGGQSVFSGSSGDVTNHELGHAVLDAVRPDLWDAMSIEVAAFHESLGDISAILSALQVREVRAAALPVDGGSVYFSSPLSRLAEELGWAIRQTRPDVVDPDCLRNAVNSFVYQRPEELPSNAPASSVSSEPHSFSRVFTGAFYDAMTRMVPVTSSAPTEDTLQQVSVDMGRLLVAGVTGAPVAPNFFAQVAAHMIEADQRLFGGTYGQCLKTAFVKRGILSLESTEIAAGIPAMTATAPSASDPSALSRLSLSGEQFGLGAIRFSCYSASGQSRRFQVNSAANDHGSLSIPSGEEAAQSFISDLARRGHIDTSDAPTAGRAGVGASPVSHRRRSTHRLVQEGEEILLLRTSFD